jgi:phosphoribosyl 1,2-cyclic phosphate phosphodiesterase
MLDIFDINIINFGRTVTIGNVMITAYPALHGNIETAGYLLEKESKRIAYFPDTAGLPNETVSAVSGVDIFICDSSFFGKNLFPNSHMSVSEAIALSKHINAKRCMLTHHAIHYSEQKKFSEMQEVISAYDWIEIANDGDKINL